MAAHRTTPMLVVPSMTPPEQTLPEAETRKIIDQKLIAAGWVIQDKHRINLQASLGVTIREMDTHTGPADYMLFIDGKACGIIEAKREGADHKLVCFYLLRVPEEPIWSIFYKQMGKIYTLIGWRHEELPISRMAI
ncbi:MAG: hypothetical protein KZQ82_12890 [Candidatus Thiodiazotropha sp. (ex Lucinoma annulata)]|nr:hypothetical protein [Candidatus Thiodiazotropha sp. (ex Lucinoma annulata)]